MQLLTWLTSLTLVGIAVAAPATADNDYLVITKQFFIDRYIIYRSNHDITNIVVPVNALNFGKSTGENNEKFVIFFVEADIQPDGTYQYEGLYILKEGIATKILPDGKDAAATAEDNKLVFLGAESGLYVYNETTNSAAKYGPITDSIIAIESDRTGDVIYILTENRELFKVSDSGETKEKIDNVMNAREMILDYSNNLYFYSDDNEPFVRTADGIKEIQGLPKDLKNVKFIKPPFYLFDGVLFLTKEKMYVIYANGTSTINEIQIDQKLKLTAYSQVAVLDQFFGFNKNIYEFNLINLLMSAAYEQRNELGNYIASKASNIRTIASNIKGKPR